MGRLIDADLLKECYAGTNALDGKADYMSIRKMIDNQSTAYDVEKVIADLQALKTKYEKLQRVCEDKFEANELHIRCLQIDKDIEIVNEGGVE